MTARRIVTLADVCVRVTDGSHRTPTFVKSGYPFVTVAHIDANGSINFEAAKKISEADFKELRRNDCRPLPGDVLFSKDGTVGKVAIIDFDVDFVVLSSLAILRPNRSVLNQRFLVYALQSEALLNQATSRKSGSAIRRIVLRDLSQISFYLPSLMEQERIVNLLDGANLLRRLRADADRRTADLVPSLFHEMFGQSGVRAIDRIRLEDIAKVVSGVAKGRRFKRKPIEVDYIRVANVQAGYLHRRRRFRQARTRRNAGARSARLYSSKPHFSRSC